MLAGKSRSDAPLPIMSDSSWFIVEESVFSHTRLIGKSSQQPPPWDGGCAQWKDCFFPAAALLQFFHTWNSTSFKPSLFCSKIFRMNMGDFWTLSEILFRLSHSHQFQFAIARSTTHLNFPKISPHPRYIRRYFISFANGKKFKLLWSVLGIFGGIIGYPF